MSSTQERQQQVRQRILTFTPEDSDRRERLLDAVDDVPFRRVDEVQTDARLMIGARIFERDLRKEFDAVGMQMSPLSSWIRGHLQEVEDDYIHRMWKRFVYFCLFQIPNYSYGSYDSFRTHIWRLKELGLIEPTREEPAGAPGRQFRQYYGIVSERVDHPAWENPTGSLYPDSTPVNVTETIDQLIIENEEQPELAEIAAELDMDTQQLTMRLNRWNIDLEARTHEVLNRRTGP